MTWNTHGTQAQDGDLVQLVGLGHKHFIVQLKAGAALHTHRGFINHDDLIGLTWGTQVFSHNGSPFFLLQPSLADLLREIKRNTQILYPKDIGFIMVSLGVGPGQHVLEAGTGSGALTTAFAFYVGPQGHVSTYEQRPQMQTLAMANIEKHGFSDRVAFKLRDIAEGFDETNVDVAFLDVPNPHDYIPQIRLALKPGGFFASILPTANQVIRLLEELRRNRFAFIDVCEVMLRYYKPETKRFRPVDRMIAHTGFLIFARPVAAAVNAPNNDLLVEVGGGEINDYVEDMPSDQPIEVEDSGVVELE